MEWDLLYYCDILQVKDKNTKNSKMCFLCIAAFIILTKKKKNKT